MGYNFKYEEDVVSCYLDKFKIYFLMKEIFLERGYLGELSLR